MYEQITPQKFGQSECVLVCRLNRNSKETWNKFQILEERDKDIELRKKLALDGLEVGEWVTIPDPLEDEWPFARRHPGKRCPPDPEIIAMEQEPCISDSDTDTDSE